jgi:hypothetical protein
MKIFLIFLNLLLAGGVLYQTVSLLKGKEKIEFTAGKDHSKSKTKPKVEAKVQPPPPPIAPEEAARIVVAQNLFNLNRCPEAVAGRNNANQMSLIGIYRVAGLEGAIIEQKRQTTRRNFLQDMQNMLASRGGRRPATPAVSTTTTLLPLQKFFRVGETLENGYKLASVGPDYVIMSRGTSTTRLQLELAGRDTTNRGSANNRTLSTEQMGQMIMMGQMRMMQMMQSQMTGAQQQGGARGTTSNRAPAARSR